LDSLIARSRTMVTRATPRTFGFERRVIDRQAKWAARRDDVVDSRAARSAEIDDVVTHVPARAGETAGQLRRRVAGWVNIRRDMFDDPRARRLTDVNDFRPLALELVGDWNEDGSSLRAMFDVVEQAQRGLARRAEALPAYKRYWRQVRHRTYVGAPSY